MNEVSPVVSIISPTYNHEKFIAIAIESVLAQTYSSWEMIILDDGSTDHTYTIARNYAKKDARIRVFTNENIGIFRLGETYNFGLSQSKGKYIAILECDDLWLPQKLELQITAMENNPQAILSWGKAYLSSIDLEEQYYIAPLEINDSSVYFNKPVCSFLKQFYKTLLPALTIVIRKDALINIGGFQQGFNLPLVDIPTTLTLLLKGEFEYIDQPLGHWRMHPHQVTKTYSGYMTLGYYSLMKSMLKQHPDIFKAQHITKKDIDAHFKSTLVISFSRSGRYRLVRKEFKMARKDYWYAITQHGMREPVWKLRSIVGLIFSFLRMDVEWLAKLVGTNSIRVKKTKI